MTPRPAKYRPAGINHDQRKLYRAAVKSLGWDDDTRRDHLAGIIGRRSSKDITLREFQTVLTDLERIGFRKTPGTHERTGWAAREQHWRRTLGDRPGMATPAQLARIDTDWDLMRWYWSKPNGFGNRLLALRGFLGKIAGINALEFLDFRSAGKVIEAMKAICNRRIKDQGLKD